MLANSHFDESELEFQGIINLNIILDVFGHILICIILRIICLVHQVIL